MKRDTHRERDREKKMVSNLTLGAMHFISTSYNYNVRMPS